MPQFQFVPPEGARGQTDEVDIDKRGKDIWRNQGNQRRRDCV